MIENVVAGEIVEIEGDIRIENKSNIKKSNKRTVVVHAESIRYVNRKDLVITSKDIEGFERFAKLDCEVENCQRNILRRLIAMFAPNVVGHEDVKLGVLRSIVGGDKQHGEFKSGFIDTFMVGDAGTAKSTLGNEATKIKPNSRHVSAPHASAKTITGIVDKENEGYTLRLGAIPLANDAICSIDEITAFPPEEQSKLLDVLQDREFDLDKYGRHFKIQAHTTIIATANPIGLRWSDRERISNDEVPMIKKLLDRFLQIYAFRDDMSEKQTHEFTKQMSIIRKRRPHNYNFLRGYLIYASQIKIRTITPEAEFMLNDFWEKARAKGKLSIRMFKGIFSIAEAQAKLQLKDVVDSKIAEQTMESVRLMMVQYGETVKSTADPRELTYSKCLEILRESKIGITVRSLFEMACKADTQIIEYIGRDWSISGNFKVKYVVDMLRIHTNVKEVGSKPLILQWINGNSLGLSDVSDVCDAIIENNNHQNTAKQDLSKTEITSYTSHTSDSNIENSESIEIETEDQTKPRPEECPNCHEMVHPYNWNTHPACCKALINIKHPTPNNEGKVFGFDVNSITTD